MIDFLDMDSNKLTISEFYENDKANKYDYTKSYQREKVWSDEKRSFFIDSILKNYPIPPVFFRMKIDSDTGETKYDVIDGKQRLTTIIDFIKGDVVLPDDFGEDQLGNSELNGATFYDLDNFEKYKKQFWRYRIPIIFIETEDNQIIRNVFDRLNRNGEPLTPQELRHAKYGEDKIYILISKLAENNYWKDMLNAILEVDRMEDKEFISELLFVLLEEKVISYTKASLDELYEKWAKIVDDKIEDEFYKIMNYVKQLELDYKYYKINKVSHLYAVWGIAYLASQQNVDAIKLKPVINSFYERMKNKESIVGAEEYRKSMSSTTKDKSSRKKRIQAMIQYCECHDINIEFTL